MDSWVFNCHSLDTANPPYSSMKAAHDVVQDFSADGVVYLELRSTPRANPKTGMCIDHVCSLVVVIKGDHTYILLACELQPLACMCSIIVCEINRSVHCSLFL